ncbi:plancitoxin-1 isoform X2 [Dermacentor silvarum]|uniref:plancitoxin-1 isoform X2 n=1 Tax=Dermacentor silvarum TaxID=543639 RepID=UPI002101A023|nr:plancitoxin-1 isoform X2 [Dermacentor silvarum]
MSCVKILLSVFLFSMSFKPKLLFAKGKISCKDAKGKDVDWFILYKLPKTNQNNKTYLKLHGGEMAYYDSTSKTPTWTLLQSDIYHDIKNPVKETLKLIFGKKPDKGVALVVYNDQPPKNFSGTRGGHSKGVLMAGKGKNVGTVWLQHSVPRFLEDLEQGYVYPTSGRENGQLFLCLSMKLEAVEVVDIYTQGLSDQVKDNITVQSWRNGAGGAQETYCTRNYSVKDVILIGVQTGSGYAEFVSKEDHSKWCVAQHKGIFCISSLNRMDSQKKRGGEVTCLLDTNLAQLFRSTIAVSTKCE